MRLEGIYADDCLIAVDIITVERVPYHFTEWLMEINVKRQFDARFNVIYAAKEPSSGGIALSLVRIV